MEIQHPLHQHSLKLVLMGSEEDDDGQTRERVCVGCDDELSGEVYACESCRLYLHQSCANLLLRIEHFIHPGCPLFLKLVPESEDGGEEPRGKMLWYRCEGCNFEIQVSRGLNFPGPSNIEEEEELLRRFSHPHLMIYAGEEDAETSSEEEKDAEPSSEIMEDAEPKCCCVCFKLIISGNYFNCYLDCGYCFHESCVGGNLPLKIRHFFHPSCTLSLEFTVGSSCSACTEYRNDVFTYRCRKCKFDMHVECAKFQPVGPEDERKRVQHWSHRHPLNHSEKAEQDKEVLGRNISCKLCKRKISRQEDDYAACEPCRFYIHKSCVELPREVQHRCHPHPLWLQHSVDQFSCDTCLNTADCFCYQCKKCFFKMCIECLLFSEEGDQVEHIVLHFCHCHPLQLFKDPKKDKTDMLARRRLQCLVCTSSVSGLTYGCKDCDVYLHKSCLDILPQTLHTEDGSFFLNREKKASCNHCQRTYFSGFCFREVSYQRSWCVPCALKEALSFWVVSPSSVLGQLHFHPCSLTLKLFPSYTCNACFARCHTHAWYCDQCDFYVGVNCAQISSEDGGEEQIQHFCHWHPLQVSQDTEEDSTDFCNICGGLCTRLPCYFCSDCDFHIHKSCSDILPQKIDKHYFNCSLVLLTTSSYRCITCQKENSSGLAFRSTERGFKICTKCVIWPENKQNDDGTFTSVHHWHQLALSDTTKKDANCVLCRSKVSSASTYYCGKCKDYFHKTCAELPLMMMQHPLHERHPLALTSSHLLSESSRNCSLCQGDLTLHDSHHSGVYHCRECGFQLDKKCATSFPSIQYQGHPHLLTVVENMQGGREVCHVCSISCINKMVFRCAEAECKFSLHLSCGPLPCKIKHSSHVHPLILEEFYVEENYTDLFPCHVCERRRDPRLPVYLCPEGCPMICEITCVISEVMPKLLGQHGEVELRSTFPNVVSKVITKDKGLTDITYDSNSSIISSVNTLPPTSTLEWLLSSGVLCHRSFERWEEAMLQSHGIELECEDEDMFTFTKEAFGHFSSKLDYTRLTLERGGVPDFISQHNGPPVGEEGMLPETLIPIYEECFGKYRVHETVANEKLDSYSSGREFKEFFVFMICAVLHNMRTTKLVDVTNERVLQWLTLLKLAEAFRIRIGFVSDRIKRVWEAHFLIKAKAIVDDTSARLAGRLEELSKREEELLRELEDVRKEKEEVKKQDEKHHKYAGDGMRSLRKEYANALLIKWKPATCITILDCQDQLRDLADAMESRKWWLETS